MRDVSAWSISNPSLNIQYERKAQSLLSLDCWVDIAALGPENPIQDVCKRGFVMPEDGQGLPFLTGNIKVDQDGPGACGEKEEMPPRLSPRPTYPISPTPSPPPHRHAPVPPVHRRGGAVVCAG